MLDAHRTFVGEDRTTLDFADDWFLDNSPGMSFDVTNGSGGSNVSRIDFQAGNNRIILFFDNGGFGEGGVVSGMIDFVLPGGSTWDIGAETTFTIKSTISIGLGTILFAGVDQSASTSTRCPAPWPSRPSPASLRFVADVADP
ncbi:MAG: hypothetical protein GY895_11040 [Phycisphaera sp.]|nr:hypothetical protein [Phycisphaera sp.]